MDREKERLIVSADQLYTLGLQVEAAREKLRQLVAKKVPYDSLQMRDALNTYEELNERWKFLEQQHLALRNQLLQKRPGEKDS